MLNRWTVELLCKPWFEEFVITTKSRPTWSQTTWDPGHRIEANVRSPALPICQKRGLSVWCGRSIHYRTFLQSEVTAKRGRQAYCDSSVRPLVHPANSCVASKRPVALERIWKWGGRHARRKMLLLWPSAFFPLQAELVVLVSAFEMVSTDWSVSCLQFFYSRCPRPQPFAKVGGGHLPPCPMESGPLKCRWLQRCLYSTWPSFNGTAVHDLAHISTRIYVQWRQP